MRREAAPVGSPLPPTDQLQELLTEHQALDTRLRELDRLVYLTPEEQVERKRIQKQKLQIKDQIQAVRGYPH